MLNLSKSFIAGVVFAIAGSSAAVAQVPAAAPSPPSPVVADYTVFLDPPTGFVFVKLPQGWKFAGTVSAVDMARLPSTVVTTLLPKDTELADADGPTKTQRASLGR